MNTGVSTTFVPLGDTWMNCIILKGSTEWSCSFQHGHVDKRPESLNPPKISPFAYRKWRRQTADQVCAQRQAEDHLSLRQSGLVGNRVMRAVVPRASHLSIAHGSHSVALLAHVTKLQKGRGSGPRGQLESDAQMPPCLCVICIFPSCCRLAVAAQLGICQPNQPQSSHLPLERSCNFLPLSGWQFRSAREGFRMVQCASHALACQSQGSSGGRRRKDQLGMDRLMPITANSGHYLRRNFCRNEK